MASSPGAPLGHNGSKHWPPEQEHLRDQGEPRDSLLYLLLSSRWFYFPKPRPSRLKAIPQVRLAQQGGSHGPSSTWPRTLVFKTKAGFVNEDAEGGSVLSQVNSTDIRKERRKNFTNSLI